MNISSMLTSVILSIVLCLVSKSDGQVTPVPAAPQQSDVARDCMIHYTKAPFEGDFVPNFNDIRFSYPVLEMVGNDNKRMRYSEVNGGRRLYLEDLETATISSYLNILEYPCLGSTVDGDIDGAVSRKIRLLPNPNDEQPGLMFRVTATLDTACTMFSNHSETWGVFKIDWSLPMENGYPQLRNGPSILDCDTKGRCIIRHDTRTKTEYLNNCKSVCSLPTIYGIKCAISDRPRQKSGRYIQRVDPSFTDECVLKGTDIRGVGIEGFYYGTGEVINGFQVRKNDSDSVELHKDLHMDSFSLMKICDANDDTCGGPEVIGNILMNPCALSTSGVSVFNSQYIELGTLNNISPFTYCKLFALSDVFRGYFSVSQYNDIQNPDMTFTDSNDRAYRMSPYGFSMFSIVMNNGPVFATIRSTNHPCLDDFGEGPRESVLTYPLTIYQRDSSMSGDVIRIHLSITGCLLYSIAYGSFTGYLQMAKTDDGLPLFTNGYPTFMTKRVAADRSILSNAQALLYYGNADSIFPEGYRLKKMLEPVEIRFLRSVEPFRHLCFEAFGSSVELLDANYDITGRVFNMDPLKIQETTVAEPYLCSHTNCGAESVCRHTQSRGSECICNKNSFQTEPRDRLSPCESKSLCEANNEDQCGFGVCRYKPCGESSCRHSPNGSFCECFAGYVQIDPSNPLSRCDVMDPAHQCITQNCDNGDCVPEENHDWACSCWEGVRQTDSTDPKSPCNIVEDICSTLECLSTKCTYSQIDGGSKCACDENDDLTWEYIARQSKCVRKLS